MRRRPRLTALRSLVLMGLLLAACALAGCTRLRAGAIATLRPISHIGRTDTVPVTPARLARLQAAPGFSVQPWARDLGHPRMLAATPDGWILVTRPDEGDVLALRDTNPSS